ncbi:relaxase domain-containing protein [Leptolyngbya sp. PL-A3]
MTGSVIHDAEHGVALGYFAGSGAQELGLAGQPIYENDIRVKQLYRGESPHTGEALRHGMTTIRTYRDEGTGEIKQYKPVVAMECCFSAPEKVSDFFGTTSPATRERILQPFHRSVDTTLKEIEASYCFTRTGAGGSNREAAKPIFACFTHFTSRNLDPQLHVHVQMFSTVIRDDGKGGALDTRALLKREVVFALGQRFRDSLQQELSKEFPYLEFRAIPIKNGTSFVINGIPDSLTKAFSSRRTQIEEKLQKLEHPTAKQVQTVVLQTRKKKETIQSQDQLFAQWRTIGLAHGFDAVRFEATAREQYLARQQVTAHLLSPTDQHTHTEPQHKNAFISSQAALKKEDVLPFLQPIRPKSRLSSTPLKHATQEGWLHTLAQQLKASLSRGSLKDDELPLPSEPVFPKPSLFPSPLKNATPEGRVHALAQKVKASVTPEWLRSVSYPGEDNDAGDELTRAGRFAQERLERWQRKATWLYFTGQISRQTYKRSTHGKEDLLSKAAIELQYFTGQIKLSERIDLWHKNQLGTPTYLIPKSRAMINFCAATGRITRTQQIKLLEQNGHNAAAQRVIRAERLAQEKRLERLEQKATWLHTIGQISYESYKRSINGNEALRSKAAIEFQYFTGQIKLSERLYLWQKNQLGTPTFFTPKSRAMINFCAATGRITRTQQIKLLERNQHILTHRNMHKY